ncbi:hypothetical protein CDL15_Pgr023219 [Punica granatum]|uniref:Uncharacterized protein n=1 Tax=Punica granatum TaxID=22663 RepID=A0A218X487_PUNGR|nr:hypothetical protein CDL15_Pgr023219 [Punica granatum]
MRMEFWDVLSDHSRELALFVLAKDNEIHQELGPVLCSSPAAVLIISHVIVMMLNCSAKVRVPPAAVPVILEGICKRASDALVLLKDDDEEIVACLLKTKLFPVVLHCPERGHGYTDWLSYCCLLPDRFSAICRTLAIVVCGLGLEPHRLLLSSVVGCYLRLSKHPRFHLDCQIPSESYNGPFTLDLELDDLTIAEWARQVRVNVAHGHYYRPIVTDKHPEALRQSFAAMLELER